MNSFLRATLIALTFCVSIVARGQADIPPALREWQGWVLKGEEFRRCPFLASTELTEGEPANADGFRCVWPERLVLNVDARGGTFTQTWQVFADSWIALPGDFEHWPRDVRVNGAAGAVVVHDEVPSLRLAPGNYVVSGQFTWSTRPEALPLPKFTALVDLSVDGQRVAQPERPDGALWLGKRRSAEQAAAMEVQVYRLVNDQIPAYLHTRIRINAAGDAREELLGRALPDGFTPVSLGGDLPARLELDGRLRVQVRAGSHDITLVARAPSVAGTLTRPDPGPGKWPGEEIWSFAADDSLRVAAAEGPEGIDPIQANVPSEWQRFPAFRMARDSRLSVIERSRGLSNVDDNRLTLRRDLWLDFDHGSFTAVDNILGTLRRDWRLDMSSPFELQSADLRGSPLLVTKGADGRTGLEVRAAQLFLTSVSRVPARGSLPATGWNQRFDNAGGRLHLPPGHRLIAALGADEAPGSWFERWGLWSVFGVALVVVFVYWTGGVVPAVIAAVALVLTYQEMPPMIWLWGNLLAALAVARAAPEGRFRRVASGYRTLSFVMLALALMPFMWMQVRFALYPQLEVTSAWTNPDISLATRAPALAMEADAVAAAAAPPAPPPPAANALPTEEVAAAQDLGAFPDKKVAGSLRRLAPKEAENPYGLSSLGLNAQSVVQRYASGTRLQAGPGIPDWTYNSYVYRWTGPVEAADSIHFVYLGPIAMFFWRILGVAALALLFVWLARTSYGGSWRLPGMRVAGASPAGFTAVWVALALWGLCHSVPALADAPPIIQPPTHELLEQLKQRLTAAPPCAPDCAALAEARVNVDGDRLEVVMRVSVLASLAVAMPHASDRWQLDEVSVDGRTSVALGRTEDSSLWLPLTPGAHTVRLSGRLAPAASIQLAFPEPPLAIEVSARGWTVSGANEGRLVSGSLELARDRGTGRAERDDLEAGAEFATFVHVERFFNFDLDWSVDTTVSRIAPVHAAISVQLPLVQGESVLTDGVKTQNDVALVGLGAGDAQIEWHSGMVRADKVEISLPKDAARTEAWNFVVNPQWHVDFEGFPAVMPPNESAGNWVFRFIPRPGEKLVAHVTRPKGVEGTTLAIDSVRYSLQPGKRSSNSVLSFEYRSTQGGRHVVKLPPDARVSAVRFDNRPVQVRPEKGELPLALSPGKHSVQVEWEEARDIGFRTRPSVVDLGSAASNINTIIQMPASRWPLFATGRGVGPAVLYWGELVVFVGLAWLLGRWKSSPLRFIEWLLLGLGLSTQSWWVFSFTALWLVVMRWREGWQPGSSWSPTRFNAAQLLLALLTVIAIFLLVFSGIRNGLLSAPDMGVEGNGSGSGTFAWFQDKTGGVLDSPAVYSVPMWSYRLLFFVWAGWMAFALVKWLRWAFNAWKTHGLWRSA